MAVPPLVCFASAPDTCKTSLVVPSAKTRLAFVTYIVPVKVEEDELAEELDDELDDELEDELE